MINSRAILFVCLGNICRSPLAEGIFRRLVQLKGVEEHFIIDSCGTSSAHSGEGAHHGSMRIAQKYSIDIASHKSRQVNMSDFDQFDLLVAMDTQNKKDLIRLAPNKKDIIVCMREFDEYANGDLNVPDPYFLGADGFEEVYQMLDRSCRKLLTTLGD